MYKHGWYKVAFERDLTQDLTAANLGDVRLVIVRTAQGIRTFGADCPHRGAHLAYGGKLERDAIVCPFHGYRIKLGVASTEGLCAHEYHTLAVGGMVLVRLSDAHENGLTSLLENLLADHVIVPGFEMEIHAPMETVIENAFDRTHFLAVHRLQTEAFDVQHDLSGALVVTSTFGIPPTPRNPGVSASGLAEVSYQATIISPGLTVVQLGGANPYAIITGATPTVKGCCLIRLSLVLPQAIYGNPPRPELYEYLLHYSRQGLEADQRMWENLAPSSTQHLTEDDGPVLKFYDFCATFKKDAG